MDVIGRNAHLAVSYEQWLEQDLAWLERCDALFYLGASPGADREKARAEELGLQVFMEIAEVPFGF